MENPLEFNSISILVRLKLKWESGMVTKDRVMFLKKKRMSI